MSKNIILCCDGTWDTQDNCTNVYRFYKALALTAQQIPFYDQGVGASGNPIIALPGGAFGTGLWEKIMRGYSKIAHVYEQGDDLFVLGFSRGAYTARSVAGMISAVGLPTTPTFTDDLVQTAFTAYRDKLNRQKILATLQDYKLFVPSIKMVGVWDTVGSLGIPAIFGGVDPVVYGFLDHSLSPLVQHAFHALAIDEKRMQFQPTLWDSTPVAGQVVEQVWFTGCHSNVGGGCREVTPGQDSLSDITLGWMISRALPLGLAFDQTVLNQYKLPIQPKYSLEPIYESWTVLNGLPFFRKVDKNAMLANSVSARVKLDPNYRPKPLTITKTGLSKNYPLAEVVTE